MPGKQGQHLKGRKIGGRVAGTPNKRTQELIDKARLDVENAQAGHRGGPRKLGKEVLDEFMHLFAGMAAHHQPVPEGAIVPAGRKPDEAKFLIYAKLAVDTARSLADFQSPKFKALMVSVAPDVQPPKQIDGNVVQLNDPVALARVYANMIKQVG
jgi:hypothetical protein